MINKISGAAKFFEQNFALFRDGGTADASSNADAARFILDISRYTQWESIGSNDLTTETIIVNLKSAKLVDRLFLIDMNFKEFNIKYDNGSGYVDFSNVVGVNGAESSTISETDFEFDTAYYQFDPVTTSRFQITCNKSQVENAQKFLSQFIATKELGTFEGFPRIQPSSTRNETKAKALSRRLVVQKTYETNKIKITFKTHPFQNDLDIVEELFNREETFLVYPCGARSGSIYFKVDQMNWRLKDIYNMQLTGGLKNEFEKGVYTLGFNKSITLEEHI